MANDENILWIVEKMPRNRVAGLYVSNRFRVFRTRDEAYMAADVWENKSKAYRYVVRRATWGTDQ